MQRCRGSRGAESHVVQGVQQSNGAEGQGVQKAKGCRGSRGAEGQQVQRVEAVKGAESQGVQWVQGFKEYIRCRRSSGA